MNDPDKKDDGGGQNNFPDEEEKKSEQISANSKSNTKLNRNLGTIVLE